MRAGSLRIDSKYISKDEIRESIYSEGFTHFSLRCVLVDRP